MQINNIYIVVDIIFQCEQVKVKLVEGANTGVGYFSLYLTGLN